MLEKDVRAEVRIETKDRILSGKNLNSENKARIVIKVGILFNFLSFKCNIVTTIEVKTIQNMKLGGRHCRHINASSTVVLTELLSTALTSFTDQQQSLNGQRKVCTTNYKAHV